MPTLLQIQGQIAQMRKKEAPNKPLTDADLINYVNEHSDVPGDENQAFIVGFAPYDEDEHFVLIWSTPKLIQVQSGTSFLATDATYKLNW